MYITEKIDRLLAILFFVSFWLAVFVFTGCAPSESKAVVIHGASVLEEAGKTEENQRRLIKSDPPPLFEQSLERKNLIRRLERLNVQNKIMYINVISQTGQVVLSSPVHGKVSSLNSLLTTDRQVVRTDMGIGAPYHVEVLPSPDFDGSYGKNPEGVFWFTPDGEYCETTLPYFMSDRPRAIHTPISLSATVDPEKR